MGKGESEENSPCYKYTINERHPSKKGFGRSEEDEEILTRHEITQIKEFLKKVKGDEEEAPGRAAQGEFPTRIELDKTNFPRRVRGLCPRGVR